ncbi:MAG: methyltransferase domain-containing protein [Chitinophagaceae bacterium]
MIKQSSLYDTAYYNDIKEGSLESARQLVPVIMQFIQPTSVVDIGCGIGTWLSVFEQIGIKDIAGMDGAHVKQEILLIDKKKFIAVDFSKGFATSKKYDLAVCLEVAEHIQPEYATNFISSLCEAADLVLFSAALPGQGGTQHVNEQYPSYWAALFQKNGFVAYDVLRKIIWNNKKVDTCYRQNIFFAVKEKEAEKYPAISSVQKGIWDIVHPEHFQRKEEILVSYQRVLRTPFHTVWHFIKKTGKFLFRKKS